MGIITHEEFEKRLTITKEDVWGDYEKGTNGMIVAQYGDICPMFNDKVPYKSVTVVCNESQLVEVEYWLTYVHGANCVYATMKLPEGKIAIRSDYQCW